MQAASLSEMRQQLRTLRLRRQAIKIQTMLIVRFSFYPLSGNPHRQGELYL